MSEGLCLQVATTDPEHYGVLFDGAKLAEAISQGSVLIATVRVPLGVGLETLEAFVLRRPPNKEER